MRSSSASLFFPFQQDNENDCLKRSSTIEDTLLSAIRFFLLTRKGSRLGSNVGSFLPEILLQLIPNAQLAALSNELKTELINNFPGVDFLNVTMQKDLGNGQRNISEMVVQISFTTANQQNISELEMRLPSVFDHDANFQIENKL